MPSVGIQTDARSSSLEERILSLEQSNANQISRIREQNIQIQEQHNQIQRLVEENKEQHNQIQRLLELNQHQNTQIQQQNTQIQQQASVIINLTGQNRVLRNDVDNLAISVANLQNRVRDNRIERGKLNNSLWSEMFKVIFLHK
jgi:RNase P/RNase MRP subunit p30